MKKNLLMFTAAAWLAVACWSCQRAEPETKPEKVMENGWEISEMRLLMRNMWDETTEMKKQIQANQPIKDIRPMFKAIHTAIPSEHQKLKEDFPAMSTAFLQTLDQLYAGDKENSIELAGTFNLMVNQCLSCHQAYCPGPMSRIGKLKISLPKDQAGQAGTEPAL